MFRVYHYCSLSTFEKIISNGTIRLYDIQRSNDSKEAIYAIDLIKEAVTAALRADHTILLLPLKGDNWEQYIEAWGAKAYQNGIPKCYAICFSSESDLLSQWRGYADDGRGVSIGIDNSTLAQWADSMGLQIMKVLYNKQKQKAKLRSIVEQAIKDIKERVKQGQEASWPLASSVFNEYTEMLAEQMVCCKSGFFKEEKEWRLFCLQKETPAIPYRVSFTDSDCRSYLEYDLHSIVGEENTLDICLGPKCYADVEDVRLFVSGIDPNCRVRKSGGSYR